MGIIYVDAQIVFDLESGIPFQWASIFFWYVLIIMSLCLGIYFFVSPVLFYFLSFSSFLLQICCVLSMTYPDGLKVFMVITVL